WRRWRRGNRVLRRQRHAHSPREQRVPLPLQPRDAMPHRRRPALWSILGLVLCLAATARADVPLEFHLRFDPAVSQAPFTGRVYVVLSKTPLDKLPSAPNWFHPFPFFAADVTGWKPGEVVKITAKSLGFPAGLDQLPAGKYWAFAVMDFNAGDRSFITGEGN